MRPVVKARSPHDNINVDDDHHPQPYPPMAPVKLGGGNKAGFAIAFVRLGRKFYQMTLWAPSYASRCKWIEHITHQQDLIRDRSRFFEMDMLSEGFFRAVNRVNCAVPFSELCLCLWSCEGAVLTQNGWYRWWTESRIRHQRWRVLPGLARTGSGTNQSTHA
jgi:Pleckstrin homology domain